MQDGEHKARQAQQALPLVLCTGSPLHTLGFSRSDDIAAHSYQISASQHTQADAMGRRLSAKIQAAGSVAGLTAVGVVAYVAWRQLGCGARRDRLPGRPHNNKQARPCWQGIGLAA